MIQWRLFKSFPKYAIALTVLVVSTGLFALWWTMRAAPSRPHSELAASSQAQDKKQEVIAAKVKSLPAKMGWLCLVGSDLYDISTGECLFENWLNGIPQRIFYQPEVNKLMVQTERGVMRYGLDGKVDAVMGENAPPAFTHDGKMAMFVKDGDIWIAEVDWKEFAFKNERQATNYGKFNAPFFAANTIMGSDKALIVRNQNQILKVNLLTGEVQQIRLSLNDLAKRRSPDGRLLIGDEPKNIYIVDAEAEDAYNFPTKAGRLLDNLWINKNLCAFIAGGRGIGLYDRSRNRVEEVATLPFSCNRMVAPSPGGSYAICYGAHGFLVVDFNAKRTTPLGPHAKDLNWINDDTLIFSRDGPDLSGRGTWLKSVGGEDRRILEEPYMTGRGDAAAFALMHEVNLVIFATHTSLYRMNSDGTDLRDFARLGRQVTRVQPVSIW